MVFKETACNQKIFACIQMIFVQPTSLLGQLGEKQPIFPCSNSIFSEDAQKCTKILILSPYFSQIQRIYHRMSVYPRVSNEICCWLQIKLMPRPSAWTKNVLSGQKNFVRDKKKFCPGQKILNMT